RHGIFRCVAPAHCRRVALPPALFFFSSRRRHTRFSRDWSSDVCSSDLSGQVIPLSVICASCLWISSRLTSPLCGMCWLTITTRRSEERRVEKECRSGGSGEQTKKKKTQKMEDEWMENRLRHRVTQHTDR